MVLGDQRVIVINTWDTMKEFWVTRNHSVLDRPHHKGFLDHIGVDISGSPMTPQIKKCRAAAVVCLQTP
jgi:phenylacetate 2-hydroxylase